MGILQFIFRDFWTFIGCLLLIAVIFSLVKAFFDFIVELIHGKPQILSFPNGVKISPDQKEFLYPYKEAQPQTTEKVDTDIVIEGGDVEVKKFGKKK